MTLLGSYVIGSYVLAGYIICFLSIDEKIVREYDQEIPQSQTANKPMAPRVRATQ